jgi:hypothetical protein
MNKFPVAETILQQLGGRKFAVMVGACSFAGGPNSLSFRFRGCKKWQACRIDYDEGRDLYTMTFFRTPRAPTYDIVKKEYDELYCDMLDDVFEAATGLKTSL